MALLLGLAFMVAWTPYTVLSLFHITGNMSLVPDWAAVFAPLFAKSATWFNAVVYFMVVRRMRKDMLQVTSDLAVSLCSCTLSNDGSNNISVGLTCGAGAENLSQADLEVPCDQEASEPLNPGVADDASPAKEAEASPVKEDVIQDKLYADLFDDENYQETHI